MGGERQRGRQAPADGMGGLPRGRRWMRPTVPASLSREDVRQQGCLGVLLQGTHAWAVCCLGGVCRLALPGAVGS